MQFLISCTNVPVELKLQEGAVTFLLATKIREKHGLTNQLETWQF